MDKKILESKNYSLSYKIDNKKKYYILRNINIEIFKKQKVALIGESGSGKSTFAYSLLNLIPRDEIDFCGEINFYSDKICCKKKFLLNFSDEDELNHIRGNHISIIFQDPFSALNPVFIVGKQVEEMILNHNKKISNDELHLKTKSLLKSVKLQDIDIVYKKFPHQLSGGQLQRICIATSIANIPELLIADEPTTSLDAQLRVEVLDLINSFVKKNYMSLLLITHDLNIVKDYVDYVYILYAGEILEHGHGNVLSKNPLHPYTQLLISAYPDKTKKGKLLPVIEGQMPNLTEKKFFTRCIFFNRCPKKIEKCNSLVPDFYKAGDSFVKCFLYEK